MEGTVSTPAAASAPSTSSQGSAQTPSQNPPATAGSQSREAPAGASPSSTPEYFDVTVNGKPVKMTRQEVIDHASKSHAADSKFKEAAQVRKQVDHIIKTAKENPIQALMDPALGLTRDQIRDAFEKWYASEYIEPETLSEDQRALKEAQTKLKKYEEQEKKAKADQERDASEKLTAHQREHLQNSIIEAIDESGLPKTKFIAQRMAFYMRQNLVNGWDAPMSLIVSQVKKERQDLMSDLTESAAPEQLISMLGDGVVKKIREHDLKQLRARRQGVSQTGGAGTGAMPSSSTEKVYMSDVNKKLRDMRQGK